MNPNTSAQLIFFGSFAFAFVSWGLAARSVWRELRQRSRVDALRPLLILHSFRFIGLAFLIPGVVSPDLPAAFSRPAACGDLVAAILALIALYFLPRKGGDRRGLAVQSLGHGGSLERLLPGEPVWAQGGGIGGDVFYPDRACAPCADHARNDLPDSHGRILTEL